MGYYLDMTTPLELIPRKFEEWIHKEICEDGLLEEVERFIPTYRSHLEIDGTTVWVYKQDWTTSEDQTMSLGTNTTTVIDYPFEVAIVVQRPDIRRADKKAIQLQSKVITSIMKNYYPNIFRDLQEDPREAQGTLHGVIENITVDTGYNDGSLEAINQEEDVVIKGVLFTLRVSIDWMECVRQKQLYEQTTGGD